MTPTETIPDTLAGVAFKAAERWGWQLVMLCFFVWWTYNSSREVVKRLDMQEMFIRDQLTDALKQNHEVMASVQTVLQRLVDKTDKEKL